MKNKKIRSIKDIDKAIENKEHQLDIRELMIRQDVNDLLEFPAALVAVVSSFRKFFFKK